MLRNLEISDFEKKCRAGEERVMKDSVIILQTWHLQESSLVAFPESKSSERKVPERCVDSEISLQKIIKNWNS